MNSPGRDRTRRRETHVLLVALCVVLVPSYLNAEGTKPETNSLPVVPVPVELRPTDEKPFRISPSTVIVCDTESKETAALAAEVFHRITGTNLMIDSNATSRDNIRLRLDSKLFSELPKWQRAE